MSDVSVRVLRPLKAIRAMCLRCQGNQYKAVRQCEATDCPAWPYRLGHRPVIAPPASKPITAGGSFARAGAEPCQGAG